ncbi:hypothetical protein FHT00_002188 [Sphingomonas insulae]|uniref:Uncharacterized protein n=1 Tax=Sphingomonas insulae TaxID=424800 RepID=A0ABN1HLR3_9SPHN|nr:hypothetical protein [Sphingomonas insulae]NIJ30225.1 hypothetical protein [Sphingomonas insulae]
MKPSSRSPDPSSPTITSTTRDADDPRRASSTIIATLSSGPCTTASTLASARLAIEPGQHDPGWWVLIALRRVGLVWGLREPEMLAPRQGLRRVPRADRSTLSAARG